MTPLRILAACAGAAAIVALGVGVLAPRGQPPVPASAPAQPIPAAPPDPPASRPAPRAAVAPGILARAAAARALEPRPVCPPAPASAEAACAPSEHDAVEIEWEVGREP